MSEIGTEDVRRRIGGRSARVREAVLAATLRMIEAGGELRIEAIAAQAGVQKTSIYRRWGSLESLVFDAAQERAVGEIAIPDTGDCREDLRRYMADGIAFHRSPFGAMVVRMMVQTSEALRRAYWGPRLEAATAILERGRARGEVAAEFDCRLAIELLVAPVYFRSLITAEPLEPAWAERLVAMVVPFR